MLEDDREVSNGSVGKDDEIPAKRPRISRHPVDLELDVVLGKMPRKARIIFPLFLTLSHVAAFILSTISCHLSIYITVPIVALSTCVY